MKYEGGVSNIGLGVGVMGIFRSVKAVLGLDGVVDSALKIVDKLAGTDFTAKERADYLLKYMEVTKYQSPTRRLLAILFASEQFMLVTVWVVSQGAHRIFDHIGAGLFASDINLFLQSNVNIAMGTIIGFYFLIGVKK